MCNENLISDELLARYLEGKVTEEERAMVLRYLSEHPEEAEVLSISAQEMSFQQLDNDKEKEGVYRRSLIDKSKLDDDTRYQMAGHGKIAMAADSQDFNCAIRAQQQILSDYGIFVSTQELTIVAKEHGWFIDNMGSPLDYVGELLNYYKVPAVQMRNANIYHLMHELSQGHKIIVGVDSQDISQSDLWQQFDNQMFGQEANHVLLLAGIDTSDPEQPQIILADPSCPDNSKRLHAKEFLGAWEDSGYFMVSTTQPAPLQYNPEMKYFDYSEGHVRHLADIAYQEIIKRMEDDGYVFRNGNKKPCRRLLLFSFLGMLVMALAILLWMLFVPFNMNIALREDGQFKIPHLPFKEGTLMLEYADMQPQKFLITDQQLTAVVQNISGKYRGKPIHVTFTAVGFFPVDTTLTIRKSLEIVFRHDDSKAFIFGHIIDAQDGKPLSGVEVQVQNIIAISDPSGYFRLDIPFAQQDKVQTLKATKSGYKMWSGTYEPSSTNGWDIVMEK